MSKNIIKYQQNMKSLRPYMRYSLTCFVLSLIGVFFVILQLIKIPDWFFFCFVISGFVSAIIFIFAIQIFAKCPACGKLPRRKDNHYALNVSYCSHCDEKLN